MIPNTNTFVMLGALAALAGLVGCSGGIDFNGPVNTSTKIQPRTSPVVHFPLPIEEFDVSNSVYVLSHDVAGVYDNVIDLGRATATPQAGEPTWAEPVTAPMPQDIAAFTAKPSTDVWEVGGAPGNNATTGVPPGWGGGGVSASIIQAASVSLVSQWLIQDVVGGARSDAPITFENIAFREMAISIVGPGLATGAATGTSQQNAVDSRIGISGQLLASQTVETSNPNAVVTTPHLDTLPLGTNATGNQIHNQVQYYNGSSFVTFLAFMESEQENLFIESNTSNASGTTSNVNIPGYFFSNGRGDAPAGIYGQIVPVFDTPGSGFLRQLPIMGAQKLSDAPGNSFYFAGAVLAHIIGLGVGLPQMAFVRPGLSNGEEDVMNAALQFDVGFFVSAGRRFQFVVEGLLRMQNNQVMPLGSAERADAEAKSAADQLDPKGARRMETLPGVNR